MKSVIVGATAGVGRALAEELGQLGHSMLLVGRDSLDLEACARSLILRFNVEVEILAADATNPSMFENGLRDAAATFGEINYLFLPIGASLQQDTGLLEVDDISLIITTNLTSVICAVQIFFPFLSKNVASRIVSFGSIAAIRGKRTNVVYSAAKRALESYFESLRYQFTDESTCVQLYKLGYVDTQQSYGQKLIPPKIPAAKVARYVVKNLGKKNIMSYYPKYWRVIAVLLRRLPLSLFKRIAH